MNFVIKDTKNKVTAVYKTIYIREDLAEKVEKLAKDNDTSFNNVVISMIEACIKETENNEKN